MKNHVLRVVSVVFGLSLSLGIAAPAQASTWNLNQTPSGSPGCTKTWYGFMNCDRANAWGVTADMGLQAVKQPTGAQRAAAMKGAIAIVATPIVPKSRGGEIGEMTKIVGASLSTNQALCMKEELQRSTNRVTAKSGLVKNYYSYLDSTYKLWKKAPLANVYQTALKNSKGVAITVLNDTERNQLKVGLTSCLRR